MHATTDGAGPLNGPWTIDTLLAADKGDGSGAWFLSLMTQAIFPRVQVWGDVAAVARSDAAHARRFFATHADRGSVIGSPGTDFLTAGGRLYDSWPASPDENLYTRVQDSNVETLLIGGRLDSRRRPTHAQLLRIFDHRRCGAAQRAVDDRHAPRRRQGRRQRGVVPLPYDPGDLPPCAGVG